MYFGKVIALQQLEDIITKIKIKYESDAHTNPFVTYHAVNKDELVKKMADLIRDQFGFGEVIVTISNESKLRASTLSFMADKNGIAYLDNLREVNMKDALVVTREGIRYDTRKFKPSILIIISMGLMFSKYISSEQIVAALLHEIGHSFSKASIGSEEFTGRIDEKFADQFATMYGYGSELSKVLTFISDNKNDDVSGLKNIPVLNVFVGLTNIGKSLWNRGIIGNDHPTIDRRVSDSIKQMEYELSRADNLTLKQKRELQRSIDRSKEILDNYYNQDQSLSNKVFKYYVKNVEPNLGKEVDSNAHAEEYGSNEMVHNRLSELFKKKRKR